MSSGSASVSPAPTPHAADNPIVGNGAVIQGNEAEGEETPPLQEETMAPTPASQSDAIGPSASRPESPVPSEGGKPQESGEGEETAILAEPLPAVSVNTYAPAADTTVPMVDPEQGQTHGMTEMTSTTATAAMDMDSDKEPEVEVENAEAPPVDIEDSATCLWDNCGQIFTHLPSLISHIHDGKPLLWFESGRKLT
jgi:hypothetical protein